MITVTCYYYYYYFIYYYYYFISLFFSYHVDQCYQSYIPQIKIINAILREQSRCIFFRGLESEGVF